MTALYAVIFGVIAIVGLWVWAALVVGRRGG